jgi:hypothetical protein
MKSLLEITTDKIRNQIIKGEFPYSEIEKLDNSTYELIFEKVHTYDLANWKYKIMDSIAHIVLKQSDDFWAVWEKYYDYHGMRDFREVIYIKIDNEHNLENVEIIDFDSPYYDSYLDAYRKYMDTHYEKMNDSYEAINELVPDSGMEL